MKNKFNAGFTLIELLVVISIVGLLSSVILASLKNAREKAVLSKTVSEMRSLQQAIELFKNDYGSYPQINSEPGSTFVDDDYQYGLTAFGESTGTNIDFLISSLLEKYISNTPKTPNFPNNCPPYGPCVDIGYVIGYSDNTGDANNYFMCNGIRVNNYFIFLYANSKKIDLPILKYYLNGSVINPFNTPSDKYTYCLAM